MNKLFLLAGTALVSSALFADGSTPALADVMQNISGSGGILADLTSTLRDFVTAALPYVAGIGSVFMGFWLGRMIFGLVKKWANSGK